MGDERRIDRIEFRIENPDRSRGEYRYFELQAQKAGEPWKTVYAGRIYGTLFGKKTNPFLATGVRLVIDDAGIRQFDVFGGEN